MSTVLTPVSAPCAPSESQLAMAYSLCANITRKKAKNFYYAFLILPRQKRLALCAVYAFMRKCDDITDDCRMSLPERRKKLGAWLDNFHGTLGGKLSDDPILLALTDAQQRFNIQVGWLDQLAYGTEMDVLQPSGSDAPADGLILRHRTFDDLRVYCYHVASVVGLVCIRIFGYRDPAAEGLAEQCGLAFQLTNIIRDVKEDAAMGRIYFPAEDLEQFAIHISDFQAFSRPRRFRPLLAMEAKRAREYYQAGQKLISYIDEDSQPALWVLLTIYERLLEKIARRDFDVFHGQIRLSTLEKLTILGKGFLKRLA